MYLCILITVLIKCVSRESMCPDIPVLIFLSYRSSILQSYYGCVHDVTLTWLAWLPAVSATEEGSELSHTH